MKAYLEYIWNLSPLQIAVDARMVDCIHVALTCGVDPWEGKPSPMQLSMTTGSYPTALRPCNETSALLQLACRPWIPFSSPLFGPRFQTTIAHVQQLQCWLVLQAELPLLSNELWMHIASFLPRLNYQTRWPQAIFQASCSRANAMLQVEAHFVALFDFTARAADELSFAKGDVISVQSAQQNGNWWHGENLSSRSGDKGFIPKNFVKKRPVPSVVIGLTAEKDVPPSSSEGRLTWRRRRFSTLSVSDGEGFPNAKDANIELAGVCALFKEDADVHYEDDCSRSGDDEDDTINHGKSLLPRVRGFMHIETHYDKKKVVLRPLF